MDDRQPRGVGGYPASSSALGLRMALALFGLVVCAALAVWAFAVDSPVVGGVVALFAVVAAVDLMVIVRRRRTRARRTDGRP